MRRRLDVELVRRGLVSSRARAASAIEEGKVLVAGAVADKASRMVAPADAIELREPLPYVSRGGVKLAAALDRFGIDVAGRFCLDAGASTGGFTDCLLQRGAEHVVAVDVGRGQLDWRLRQDPRVTVLEGVNVRDLTVDALGGRRAELVTADLSFISLAVVAPALTSCATEDADLVLLVKPQFEAGRAEVGRGGVVRDPDVHRRVIRRVRDALATAGLGMGEVTPSPIRGASGNVEFVAHVRLGDLLVDDATIDAVVDEAHGEGGT